MASTSWTTRLRELTSKYGKVAVGVHFSVSALTTATFYAAIRNNVDVVSGLERIGLVYRKEEQTQQGADQRSKSGTGGVEKVLVEDADWKEDTAAVIESDDPAASSSGSKKQGLSAGGALGLALICNKALFPIRVPITIMLTPQVAKLLTRFKNGRFQ